jgi:concanavalin A-like lectin/glucanase superfamily protein
MKKALLFASLFLQAHSQLAAEVIHHSSFDKGLAADGGKNWAGKDSKFCRGVKEQAIDLSGASYISFSDKLPFNNNEGTLELWLKTNWPGNDGKDHGILALGKTSGIRISKSTTNELMFMWAPNGSHSQVGMKFSIARDWPAGEWRHLVFTWKQSSFLAYLDGVVRKGMTADQDPSPLPETTPVYLGGFEPIPGDLSVDEFALRNDQLSREEVLQHYVQGMEALEQRSDPRLVMRQLIEKKPATLILDTGSVLNVLFKPFAVEAGLKLMPSYRGRDVFNEETDALLTLDQGKAFKLRFIILENVTSFDQQGFLGWTQFFRVNRLHILWDYRTVKPLTEAETHSMTQKWQEHAFSTNPLKLVIPATSLLIDGISLTLPIVIDTGDGTGLSLTKKTWDNISSKLNQRRRGFDASWTPTQGAQTNISIVPETIELWGTQMKNISVSRDRHERDTSDDHEEARIGLAALSCFDVVIDGLSQKLWLRPRSSPAIREEINLSGLLFVKHTEKDGEKTVQLHVLEDSPAWRLGMRTGDTIIELDDHQFGPAGMDFDEQIDVKRRLSQEEPVQIKIRRGQDVIEIRTGNKNRG